ncbi:MAG: DUF362 domain-containing protein [Desulfobulbaceae bacterium]|nr:DUF362 domain-containing protein [Desulfobulbaceae bacterium]
MEQQSHKLDRGLARLSADGQSGLVYVIPFTRWQESVAPLLIASGLLSRLGSATTVLLKPNLVKNMLPPATTPAELVGEIVIFLRRARPELRLIIAEGTGDKEYDTAFMFRELGYTKMAAALNVELLDLNLAPLRRLCLAQCQRWPEMYLPEILFDSFLISVPVLKAHSLAEVTLTMKNMLGCAPPAHYQRGGHWKKSAFHDRIQEAVLDLNRYRTPDFTILDATVGMCEAHVWGAHCQPPCQRLAAAVDPVAIDAYGAELLHRDWHRIGHIRDAHGELGQAEPLTVIAVA